MSYRQIRNPTTKNILKVFKSGSFSRFHCVLSYYTPLFQSMNSNSYNIFAFVVNYVKLKNYIINYYSAFQLQ